MAALPKPIPDDYTIEEYLALEAASDRRHEFWYGEIFAMSGGSRDHARIGTNVVGECYRQLLDKECRPISENGAVKNTLAPRPDWPLFVYPDATVVCDEPVYESIKGIDVLVNPTLVVEVISPTSAVRDVGDKFTIYTSNPAIRHYLLIESETVRVTHWFRDDTGTWVKEVHSDRDDVIRIERPPLELLLRRLYA
jgi:Uma2 family endonuclease